MLVANQRSHDNTIQMCVRSRLPLHNCWVCLHRKRSDILITWFNHFYTGFNALHTVLSRNCTYISVRVRYLLTYLGSPHNKTNILLIVPRNARSYANMASEYVKLNCLSLFEGCILLSSNCSRDQLVQVFTLGCYSLRDNLRTNAVTRISQSGTL